MFDTHCRTKTPPPQPSSNGAVSPSPRFAHRDYGQTAKAGERPGSGQANAHPQPYCSHTYSVAVANHRVGKALHHQQIQDRSISEVGGSQHAQPATEAPCHYNPKRALDPPHTPPSLTWPQDSPQTGAAPHRWRARWKQHPQDPDRHRRPSARQFSHSGLVHAVLPPRSGRDTQKHRLSKRSRSTDYSRMKSNRLSNLSRP